MLADFLGMELGKVERHSSFAGAIIMSVPPTRLQKSAERAVMDDVIRSLFFRKAELADGVVNNIFLHEVALTWDPFLSQ